MRDKGEQEHWIKNNTSTPSIILVVEDDEGLLRLIQKNLQRAGFQTEGALNGVDAIAYLVNNQSKLILLDYSLPDMSGKQVIESLTEQHRSVPFIIMTGHGDEKVAVEMMKLGARDYLVKDAEFLDVLPSVVKRVVEQLEVERRLNETELKLKESEEKYHDLIESANAGIVMVENEKIVQVNRKAEEFYGYSRGELIGQSPRILTPENYWKKHSEVLNEYLQSGKVGNMVFEEEGVRKDGFLFPIEISFSLSERGENSITIIAVMRDVTERKKSEEALRESEERYRLSAEYIPLHLGAIDQSGKFILWNKYSERMLGYTADEAIGKMTPYTIHESKEDAEEVIRIASERGMYDKEINFVHKNKSLVPVHLVVVPKKNENGEIKGFYGFAEDITARKNAEEVIRKSEQKYHNLIESANDGIVSVNGGGIIIGFNKKAEEIFGYQCEEILGKPVFLLSPGEYREREKKALNKFRRSKQLGIIGKTIEREGLRKDGRIIPLEATWSVSEMGDEWIITAILRDVSERKKTEKEFHEAKEFLEKVIESSKDGIIITDEKGHILSVNTAIAEMSGFTKEELIGQHPSMFVIEDKDEMKKILEKTAELFKKGFTFYETTHKNKDGTYTEVECNVSLIKDDQGNSVAGVAIVRDITIREKMEQQLLQSEKLKSLGELAGGVAHDFNNVLAAILGRVQLLRMRLAPPPGVVEKRKAMLELQQGLDIIEKASLDGAETVRRIQEFSRKRADDKNFTQVDINELIRNALEFTRAKWRDTAEAKGIKIAVKKHLSPLPPTIGSESELREVFTNLINNALDAMMPKGGQVTIKSFYEDNHICVGIKDSGIGIPEAIRERIFDPFFTTKGPQSTGLGLSVSYGIINRHKGTITVDSKEGKGSTFTIRLPLLEKEIKEVKIESAPVKQRKARILIIEDEEGVRNVLKDVLNNAGHDIEVASDGIQGIELFEKREYDLVFTDLGMPVMSGWQVAERIKAINKKTPVALITGWNIDLNEFEMKSKGVDLIIKKPFAVNRVLRAVQEAMELKDRFKAA